MNILKISIISTFSAFLFAQASWGSTGIQEGDNIDDFGYPLNFSYILKINTLEELPSQEDIDDLLYNGTGTIQETFELARIGHVDSIEALGDFHFKSIEGLVLDGTETIEEIHELASRGHLPSIEALENLHFETQESTLETPGEPSTLSFHSSEENMETPILNGTETIEEIRELVSAGHTNFILTLGNTKFQKNNPIKALKYYIWGFQKHWLETGEQHLGLKEKILQVRSELLEEITVQKRSAKK